MMLEWQLWVMYRYAGTETKHYTIPKNIQNLVPSVAIHKARAQ